MNNQIATPATQRYSRRFWLRLRPKLRIWDFLMGLVAAVLTPPVHNAIFTLDRWWTYVIAAVLTYAGFFVIYMAIKAILLLIERDKSLEIAEIAIPKLERRVRELKANQIKRIYEEANYLWQIRDDSQGWQNSRIHWMSNAVSVIADSCEINNDDAEKMLFDSAAMESYSDREILKRHISNLRQIIKDFFPSENAKLCINDVSPE